MAENKKSFILYADLIHTVKKLDNENAGELFKHILMYVNDENPKTTNQLIDIAFEPIKQQLKRDLVKWDEARDKKSEGGKLGNIKRWYPEIYDKIMSEEITLEEAEEQIAKIRIESDTDTNQSDDVGSVAVNVTVNDNANVKYIIDYLNNKCNTSYKQNSRVNRQYINARLNEGYTLEDFYKVIDVKTNAWLNDSKMKTYLRPQTLFGTKFESYLQEWKEPKPEQKEDHRTWAEMVEDEIREQNEQN